MVERSPWSQNKILIPLCQVFNQCSKTTNRVSKKNSAGSMSTMPTRQAWNCSGTGSALEEKVCKEDSEADIKRKDTVYV